MRAKRMNMKYETLKDLKKEIHQQIAGLMSKNCVLLNTPNHVNIGDILIWQGEIDFLKSINIEPSYTTSNFNFDWRDFDEEILILLHGGGNFGDIWEYHQEFRKEVIKKYPNNRILIFPQSVEYNNKETIKEDAILFSKHENITICARDSHYYTLLKEHFKNNTILMVPDMAFCMDIAKKPNKPNKNILLLKRNDREISETISYNNLEKIEILDWPTFNPSFKNSYYRVIEKLSKVFSKPALSKIFSVGKSKSKQVYDIVKKEVKDPENAQKLLNTVSKAYNGIKNVANKATSNPEDLKAIQKFIPGLKTTGIATLIGAAYQIIAGTAIESSGFWGLDKSIAWGDPSTALTIGTYLVVLKLVMYALQAIAGIRKGTGAVKSIFTENEDAMVDVDFKDIESIFELQLN